MFKTRSIQNEVEYEKILHLLANDSALRDSYREKAKTIDKSIANFKDCKDSTNNDVFICVKISASTEKKKRPADERTKDFEVAEKLYKDLKAKGKKPFFSFYTLKNEINSDDLIWTNLVKSKKMVLIGSKRDYLESIWVKSEWKRWLFLDRINNLYILTLPQGNQSPYDILPSELGKNQIYTISNYNKLIHDLCEKKSPVVSAPRKKSGWKFLFGTIVALTAAAFAFFSLGGDKLIPELSLGGLFSPAATTEPHTHIFGDWTVSKAPDCSSTGEETRTCECGEIETKTLPAIEHSIAMLNGKNATCTETGLTDGKKCSVCQKTLVAQTIIPKKEHAEIIDKGYAATCTETGLSDGSHCEECGEIIEKQITLPISHNVVINKGFPATCTETGLTDSSYCSVCGKILSSQEIVSAKGHTAVADKGYNATCTKTGLTDGSHCGECKIILTAQEIIPITHTISTKTGNTACEKIEYCTLCGLEQASTYNHNYRNATCTTPKTCLNCGETDGVPAPHNYDAATCIAPQTCKSCGFKSGDALGHFYEDNICIRCNEADPDCLFENLHVIDSSGYKGTISDFTDTYGDNYDIAFEYYASIDGSLVSKSANMYSIHNLKKSYTKLSGAFVAGNKLDIALSIEIYVDDNLAFSSQKYDRTTGKMEFSVDITNASTVKFRITSGSVRYTVKHAHIALVDVKLTK